MLILRACTLRVSMHLGVLSPWRNFRATLSQGTEAGIIAPWSINVLSSLESPF
jgi:hypothetical protein